MAKQTFISICRLSSTAHRSVADHGCLVHKSKNNRFNKGDSRKDDHFSQALTIVRSILNSFPTFLLLSVLN